MLKFSLTAGLDEAGRGCLAGPVCAGCVVLPPDFPVELLNDSKKLTPKKRESLEPVIKEKACWGIGLVDYDEIDRINILQASLKAMCIAWDQMILKLPEWCEKNGITVPSDVYEIETIVDGNQLPEIKSNIRTEIKADAKFESVMAASILAKVERDRIMIGMDKLYPEYGYARHKGYPTPEHKKICRQIGPSPIQRLTFNIQEKSKN